MHIKLQKAPFGRNFHKILDDWLPPLYMPDLNRRPKYHTLAKSLQGEEREKKKKVTCCFETKPLTGSKRSVVTLLNSTA